MLTTYIGIGSNIDTPLNHVRKAIAELDQLHQCHLVKTSPIYRSKALGPSEQPDYLNAVVQLDTQLKALELLDILQDIEHRHGRERVLRWGPRTLDLDILLYGNEQISSQRLNIPYVTQLNFVLYPLLAIAPELSLPDGRKIKDLPGARNADDIELLDQITVNSAFNINHEHSQSTENKNV